jgi:fructokinase
MIQVEVPRVGTGFLPLPGGCSYNTSIAIGRLGVPVQFLGPVSTDFFGGMILKRLRENNVGSELIVPSRRNTTLAIVNADNVSLDPEKGPQYAFYTDGTSVPLFSPENIPAALPAGTCCVVFGSISMNMEPIAGTIETFIQRYQSEDSPVIAFDPNVRPIKIADRNAWLNRFEKWTAASTIVKLSCEDAEYAFPGLEPPQALNKILSLGPSLAVCTLGPDGAIAMLRCGDGGTVTVNVSGIPVTVVDTVGAGDTFHGAFLSRLFSKGKLSRRALAGITEAELHDAVLYANKAASVVCSRHGADPPNKSEISC